MENIVKFPDRKIIEQEALDWMVTLDGDESLSKVQLEYLKEWLNRSPVHQEELQSLHVFWQNNILTELVVPLDNSTAASTTGVIEIMRSWFTGHWQFASAMAVVLFSVSLLLNSLFSVSPMLSSNGTYLTAVGKQSVVELADGSVLHLNTDSQVEVTFTEQYRNIRVIQGEAHFQVAKNKQYPFRVYAGDGRVEAVGTAFSVYLDHQNIDVLVTEGRVAVAALVADEKANINGEQLQIKTTLGRSNLDNFAQSNTLALGLLDAGQRIKLNLSETEITFLEGVENISTEEMARQQAWQQGLLVFSGETLAEVVAEISRFSTMEIEIMDEQSKAITIGGRYRVSEIEGLLQSLENNFDVKLTRLGYNRVQLSYAK